MLNTSKLQFIYLAYYDATAITTKNELIKNKIVRYMFY